MDSEKIPDADNKSPNRTPMYERRRAKLFGHTLIGVAMIPITAEELVERRIRELTPGNAKPSHRAHIRELVERDILGE